MTATCELCSHEFRRDQPWKTFCPECWRWKRSIDGGNRSLVQTRQSTFDEIEKYRAENAKLKRENDALRKRMEVIEPILKRNFLLKNITLTHPDLHGGSKKATDVTSQLLEIMNCENI